jgi:hypothetical protein
MLAVGLGIIQLLHMVVNFVCSCGLARGKIQVGCTCSNVALNFKNYLDYQLICKYPFLASFPYFGKLKGRL